MIGKVTYPPLFIRVAPPFPVCEDSVKYEEESLIDVFAGNELPPATVQKADGCAELDIKFEIALRVPDTLAKFAIRVDATRFPVTLAYCPVMFKAVPVTVPWGVTKPTSFASSLTFPVKRAAFGNDNP